MKFLPRHFAVILFFFVHLSQIALSSGDSIPQKIILLENLKVQIIEAEDTSKIFLNEQFKKELHQLIMNPSSLHYDFSSLKSVSVLTGPGKNFRIYTWVLELGNNSYDYFGFTQFLIDKKKKSLKIVELKNNSSHVPKIESISVNAEKWLGALYYELVSPKSKKDCKVILLGWDGNGAFSNKKIIEVLSFSPAGEPIFGAPILKVNVGSPKKAKNELKHRLIFEFSEKSSMTLTYDESLKMIVHDHLSPSSEVLKNVKASYAPDFSYDGFYYKKGKWLQQSNLDARNPKMPKPKKYKASDYEQ